MTPDLVGGFIKARFIRTVTADTPVDPTNPTDPTYSVLTDESFDEGGLDGQVPTAENLTDTFDSRTGSGSLTLTDERVRTGGLGLRVDGTSQDFLTFGPSYPTHTQHFLSPYWYHEGNPSADAWIGGARDGTDSADAFQYGINSTGHVIVRDGGSGAVDGTSVAAIPVGAWYRFCAVATGTVLNIYALTGADEASLDMGDAVAFTSCTITATSFSKDKFGLLVAISGTGGATGSLQNVLFEAGSNGNNATTALLGGTWTGTAGSCKVSTAHPYTGTRGLRIGCGLTDPTYNSGRYDNPSHTEHAIAFAIYIVSGSGTPKIYELRDGGGTTVAAQIDVNSSRQIRIRNGFTTVATSTALNVSQLYVAHAIFDGAGGITLRYFTGATIGSNNPADAVETITGALTATNFSDDIVGLVSDVTGTPDIYIDDFRSSNTLTPPAGTIAVGIRGVFDRYQSDSATMPPPLAGDVDPPPPETSGILVPTSGIYIGATTGPVGAQSSSNAAGMATYMTITGNIRPHIVHVFITAANWSGIPTSMERNLFRPAGQAPAIPNWTWKPGTQTLTWRQVADGANDAGLRGAARGLKQYGHQQFLSFQNEADLHIDGSHTTADYKAMVRHCIDVFRSEGVTREHVLFVYKMGGYSGKAGTNGAIHNAMYPGDDYIDWLAYDPYWDAPIRTGLDLPNGLLNEDIAGAWDGFYTWATTPSAYTDGTKPIMVNEYGTDFNDLSDASAAPLRVQQLIDGIQNFPRVKALIWWNSTVSSGIDSQLYGHPNTIAKYRALCQMAYTQQTVS